MKITKLMKISDLRYSPDVIDFATRLPSVGHCHNQRGQYMYTISTRIVRKENTN